MLKRLKGAHPLRRCVLLSGIFALAACLYGCGAEYPQLSEEQEEEIVRYAATLLYANDQNHSTRLMDEEEMATQMRRQAALLSTPVPKEEDSAQETSGEDEQENSSGGSEAQTEWDSRTLAEFFGLDGIDISYQDFFFTESYPESGEDEFFAMDALEGNIFLILRYQITNRNTETAQVNILELQPKFRAFIDDGAQINAMTTLLTDDLKTTNCSLEPGMSCSAVVVFEITKEEAASMQKLVLTVKAADDSWKTLLFEASGETGEQNTDAVPAESTDGTAQGNGVSLHFDIPEGFIDQGGGLYCTADYPEVSANINVVTQTDDTQTFQYTQEEYCEAVKALLGAAFGFEVDVSCTEFVKSELDGYPTLLARITYMAGDMQIEQVQFAVETQENVVTAVTFTQEAGEGFMNAFNACIFGMTVGPDTP